MTRRPGRLIGIVGYPDVVALDVVGAFDAFAIAADMIGGPVPAYRCALLSPSSEPFTAASGLRFTPDFALAHAPAAIDTIIVAGGGGIRTPSISAEIAAWLMRRAARVRRIASVCIGIYGVAPTGLLDGAPRGDFIGALRWMLRGGFRPSTSIPTRSMWRMGHSGLPPALPPASISRWRSSRPITAPKSPCRWPEKWSCT